MVFSRKILQPHNRGETNLVFLIQGESDNRAR